MRMNVKWLGAAALALTAAAVGTRRRPGAKSGPPGGTVISLEADPHDANKLYLGTSDGHVIHLVRRGRALAAPEPHRRGPR